MSCVIHFFAPTYGNTVTVDWISKFDNFPEISDALHLNSKIFYNLAGAYKVP